MLQGGKFNSTCIRTNVLCNEHFINKTMSIIFKIPQTF